MIDRHINGDSGFSGNVTNTRVQMVSIRLAIWNNIVTLSTIFVVMLLAKDCRSSLAKCNAVIFVERPNNDVAMESDVTNIV